VIVGPAAALLVGATFSWSPVVAPAVQDTAIPPPTQQDTLAPDTAAADTVAFVSVRPDDVPHGPLVPGSRITFTRDSILWSSALTVSDLLGRVPGVFVARGGFLGQPEYIMYAGRGPTSIEVFWDGTPLQPLGDDSVYVDPGRIPVSYLGRVEVEVLPAGLRVYLVTERFERVGSHSAIRVMSGAFSTAEYTGLFQKRWANGIGVSIAADYSASDGAQAVSRSDNLLELWANAEWQTSPRTGVSYQIRRQDLDRDEPAEDGGAPFRSGIRTDLSFRMHHAAREDRRGFSFDLGVGSSAWTGDSLLEDQHVRLAYGTVRYRLPFLNGEVTGRLGDARIERAVEGRLGLVPLPNVVLAASGYWRDHGSGQTSKFGVASGGLVFGPFSLTGEVSHREGMQAASLLEDSVQQTNDMAARFGMVTRRLTGHIGLAKREMFLPIPAPDLESLPPWGATPAATYLIADLQLRVIDPVTISAWYSHPDVGSGALQPPKHGRADITFRSRFLRQFRSGVFGFKLSYGIEFWSRGVAGIDEGIPLELPGATFHELFAQFQLVDFRLFYNLRNARNSLAQYVPGFPYPRNAQTFGVKWEFVN
jgi:hypothetical protein